MGWLTDAMNIQTNDNEYKIRALESDLRDLQRELDYTKGKIESEKRAKYGDVNFYERVLCRISDKIDDIEREIRRLS